MDIDIKDIVYFVGIIGVGATNWFRNEYQVKRLVEKDDEKQRQIDAFWKWKDGHDRDSSTTRENLNREISEIRGGLLVNNEQFKRIMEILEDMKEELKDLRETRFKDQK